MAAEGGAGAGPAAPASRTSAGAKLRSTREAQGLTVEAVAQQLKLSPRQVQALESDDYGRLPGRTFVRGFARNYARFVQLDPDAIVALLPTADAAPALERPGFGPVRRAMGELPVERASRRSVLRWFVPLVLAVIVATAGYYEYLRQHGMLHPIAGRVAGVTTGASVTTGTGDGAATPDAAAAAPAAEPAVLPNPLAGREVTEAGAASKDSTGSGPATSSAGVAPPSTAASPGAGAAAAPATGATPSFGAPAAAGSVGTISVAQPAGSAAAPLVLKFNGGSWVEVRDASGRVILKATEAAGTTRSVDGNPPFQLTLGDAPKVAVTFRGQPLDLGPYTRGDVARVTLK
ncbi:MAG TPA: RodZ domain-containing protein [Casimicrobiaceae bacterium]